MAFDAYFLTAVLDEIRQKAMGARIEKIHQPRRDTVLLLLKCEGGREKLLLAANPAAPRLHLTADSPENPPEPPMFCMLLRKHLSGARLAEITQPPMERLAIFTFDCIDELGDPVQKKLVAELMGRTCNLYLLGPDGASALMKISSVLHCRGCTISFPRQWKKRISGIFRRRNSWKF